MEEKIDILNENGELTGDVCTKKEAHEKGLWHMTAHIWIINNKNEILLQRRSPNKDSYPNMLDISAAGHLSAGDTPIIGAIREIKEEIGLTVNENDLEQIMVRKTQKKVKDGYFNNEFSYVYILKINKTIQEMVMQEEEVSELIFFPFKKFKEMVDNKQKDLLLHMDEFEVLFEKLQIK